MGSADRSMIKYLSICGILTNVALFIASFYGRTVTNTLPIVIGSGIIMVGLGLSLTLDPAIPFFSRMFFWTKFWGGKPSWGRPLYILLFAFLLAQFVLLALHGASTVPVIVDGEPLTSANGEIIKAYTQAQQLYRDASALRFFCTLMLANYYQILMYSLFPLRNR
jgi:hypothetical protein